MVAAFEDVLAELESAPELLRELVERLTEPQLHVKPRGGAGGGFAVVEHLWHLADLDADGYGRRIDLLLAEEWPFLEDFDGDRVARERDYLARRSPNGLRAFALARTANVEVLKTLSREERLRAGSQEGVGTVTLGAIPEMMRQHDHAHFTEIIEVLESVGLGRTVPAALRRRADAGRPVRKSA